MPDETLQIDPSSTALLVMDYQPGIVGMLPDPEPLLSAVERLLARFRERGGHVGFVRVAFTDEDVAAIPETSPMRAAASRAQELHADAPATQVHERLAPQDGEIVVRKVRVGSFSTTDLDEQLRGRGVDTLVLAGLSTSGVVLSTVRDGADRDYRMIVVSDACADPQPGVHDFLCEHVLSRQAAIATAAEVERALGG